jgi:hypothetical protein
MRFSTLCLAVLASCAASGAHALNVSIDGAGDAVLLPYYSVFDRTSAVFSVVNHDDEPSVVRVVVAEGRNGRAALTFNVYLAGNDSWQAALLGDDVPSPPVTPYLVSNDTSCTSAVFPATGISLRTDGYTGSRDDGLHEGVGRLFMGQIEVIELGKLTGSAAQRVQAGDCDALRARFAAGGAWDADPNAEVAPPAGRISAELQLIDVAAGVAFGIEPLVLQGFSGGPRHGRGDTDFQAARIYKPTAKNVQGNFDVAGAIVDGRRPADAVSLLLMSADIETAFSTEDSLDARTDIVVAFPTRPAYVDNRPGGELPAGSAPIAPFDDLGPLDSTAPPCVDTTWRMLDRDGAASEPETVSLCEQVNLRSLADGEIEGIEEHIFYTGDMQRGRMRIGFDPEHRAIAYISGPVEGNARVLGLPAAAVSLTEFRNVNAQPGVLASYAVANKIVRRRDGFVDF